TVNLLRFASMVRIHPLPPNKTRVSMMDMRGFVYFQSVHFCKNDIQSCQNNANAQKRLDKSCNTRYPSKQMNIL
ncbi:MAG: hypothetical protein RR937_07020, partial [Ruthenibacterium sp.]